MPTYGSTTNIGPAYDMEAITPNDTTLIGPYRGIAFAATGALALTLLNNDEVVIPSGVLAAGVIHALQFKRVKSAGTTATSIWGFK